MLAWKAQPVEGAPHYVGRVPGRVVNVVKGGGVDVLTGDGILRPLEVQFSGEEPGAASAVVRSVRASLGMRTADLVRRIEALERALARLVDSGPSRPE